MGKRLLAILAVVAGLACVPLLRAQSGLGNITGHVVDPSGAVIPNATVSATNVATGVTKTATTNSAGVYQLQSLVPGRYNLQATAPNFKTLVREGITLQVEDQLGIDLKLEIGTASQSITVQSDVTGLRTEDAQTGEVITKQLIETIPNISTGSLRDPFALITVAGNVQSSSGARAGYGLNLGGSVYSSPPDTRVNGGRTGSTEYLVDGVPVTEGFVHNVANSTPATEDVAEFKVITNGLSAEYGRLSGGAVSIATQGGTNSFHGQIFEYHQDAALNANNFQNTAQTPIAAKSNFRQNDFGAAGGGPVLIPHLYNGRNKTFWFANYEGLRNSQSGNVTLAQTITDLQRTGDLREIGSPDNPNDPIAKVWDPFNYNPNQVIDPNTGNLTYEKYLAAGCPSQPGQCIPTNELNPISQEYIKLLPHPNHAPIPGTGTAGNFSIRQPATVEQTNWSARVDQNLGPASSMYGRFSYSSGNTYTGPLNPVLGTYSYTDINGGFSATLHYNHAFSPTTLLDLHVGGNYNPWEAGSRLPSSYNNASLGFSPLVNSLIGDNGNNIFNVHNGPFSEGMNASANLPGGGQLWPMLQAGTYTKVRSTTYDYAGSLTKILGRHSLKFGYEGRRYFDNPLYSAQANSNNNGDGLAFTADAVVNQYLDMGSNTWGAQANSSGLGQFLLGVDTWAQITAQVGRSLAQNYYASYVQDDFKVTPRLTLNLGMRWEMETPTTERHNNMSIWDPNAAPPFTIESSYSWSAALAAAGLDPSKVQSPPWLSGFLKGNLVLAGTPEHPSRMATNYHPWNFSPRFGFAFQVDPKTVVRGSFALLYLPTSGNISNYGDAPGVTYSTQAFNNPTQVANYSSLPGQGLSVLQDLFTPEQVSVFQHDTHTADVQTTQTIVGTGGINVNSHMPMEADWGLSVQRALPGDWLLEVLYSANNSTSLLASANPSRFPANLHTGGPNGQNYKTYTTTVASPFGSQVPCINPNSCGIIGAQQSLGILEYAYPYYGPVLIEGSNIGKSNYESGTIRVDHRYKSGLYMLFNYTFAKNLDDTGGANVGLGGSVGTSNGTNGKPYQTVYDIRSSYGLDPADETHRISATYIYDLPFGRGRKWMNQPQGIGGAILDGFVGGWNIAGTTGWNSGTPIQINPQNTQADSYSVYNFYTGLSLLPGKRLSDMFAKNFHGNRSVYVAYGQSPKAGTQGRLDPSAVDNYTSPGNNPSTNGFSVTPFTNGNVPSLISFERNPSNWTTNLSVMKNFPFSSDGARYFQLRVEAPNVFNHPGFGGYDTNPGDNTFGFITSPANTERHLQVGGRVVF